ncbi:hypothetical protein HMPREF1426_00393 [Helicobacter pylori GAM80Ai]|nr:hypothetical protein HMPREF1426_00393 [Helicobacter pylori GAM80Ai]
MFHVFRADKNRWLQKINHLANGLIESPLAPNDKRKDANPLNPVRLIL